MGSEVGSGLAVDKAGFAVGGRGVQASRQVPGWWLPWDAGETPDTDGACYSAPQGRRVAILQLLSLARIDWLAAVDAASVKPAMARSLVRRPFTSTKPFTNHSLTIH